MNNLKLYWGDIHNHNEVGVGKGSPERSYSIAQSSLDFYAFTPHGWWVDMPGNDPRVGDYHLAGFAKVKEQWDLVVDRAKSANQDDRFTALDAPSLRLSPGVAGHELEHL